MNLQNLTGTAKALVADDKGLLAMDESNPTCNKRFAKLDIPQTVEAGRAYREMIVTTPGLGECISGTASSVSSSQVQPGCAARRIHGRDGKSLR